MNDIDDRCLPDIRKIDITAKSKMLKTRYSHVPLRQEYYGKFVLGEESLETPQGKPFRADDVCHPYNTLEHVFITDLKPGDVVYATRETHDDVFQAFLNPITIIARTGTMSFVTMQGGRPMPEEMLTRSAWLLTLRQV